MKLVSVVLSGGAGTRLWPASRQAYPKPFMKLGGRTLLEQAISRGQDCGAGEVLVVTNQEYLFLSENLVAEMADPPQVRYMLEPKGRNTAPAIALASISVAQTHGRDAVMLVLPADHLIPDTSAFVSDALRAAELARKGQLVVFGIQPTAPETGFGYIEVTKVSSQPQSVLNFIEKPNLATAQGYLAEGRYYWNSGMFCFTAGSMLDAFAKYAPDILECANEVMATAQCQPSEMRFNAHAFGLQPDISIDYAIMERANNVSLIPAKFGWSDVGAWTAVADAHTPDLNGNTLACEQHIDWVSVNTSGTHVHIDSHGHKSVVATVGVKDLIVVHMPDALLIADKKQSQDVKKVVEILKQRHINSAQHQSTLMPPSVNRPWGTYATIREEGGYKVKRISVRQGQCLSLQYHHRRAEHWVVVRGRGIVQIGDVEYLTEPGQYRYIPLNETHRLTNVGEEELILIEVQCGDYLGEDDIVRLADVYGRA
ncbi:mannose-1-phosphate guanylyltransferase/mannose-6-phosphate isomerase [Polynucleobacter sphagniphilus]|uniref:mannose-1-phosphate guanylyltransferase/mannose-6-phosphate isomerase n=1 Tax=Polynucleobacter sphagniphilus TaxID=1743169 RepID=UPI0024771165|nr:mannose-1-phosphate guanylyltransferase/mannose-6-phosphate isomerase [Polynucleobacter sphagniphilus]MDH6420917.1 mannose-1-phosphate guanylyltransferase/mannose-6-phosphate isomerase [Polynucleobacter sphagniphilus]